MTNKLVVIINSLKYQKLENFTIGNEISCTKLQLPPEPLTKGLPPPDPRSLCPQLNLLNPPEQNSWIRHWYGGTSIEISRENWSLIKNGKKVSDTLYEDVSTFTMIWHSQTGHRTSNTMAQRRCDLHWVIILYLLLSTGSKVEVKTYCAWRTISSHYITDLLLLVYHCTMRQAMYVQRDVEGRLRNHRCCGKIQVLNIMSACLLDGM